jgi:dipeptidase E
MIIQTSNGLSTDELIDKMKLVLPKSAKKAVVVTTASSYKSEDKHIPEIKQQLSRLNIESDLFDFEFDDLSLLEQYDVMVLGGGNPYKLLKEIYKSTELNLIVRKFAKKKVLIGISAGSIILGESLAIINEFDPQMFDDYFSDCKRPLGMNMAIDVVPHYTRFKERYDHFESRIKEVERKNDLYCFRLNDGEAIGFSATHVRSIQILYMFVVIFFFMFAGGLLLTYIVDSNIESDLSLYILLASLISLVVFALIGVITKFRERKIQNYLDVDIDEERKRIHDEWNGYE